MADILLWKQVFGQSDGSLVRDSHGPLERHVLVAHFQNACVRLAASNEKFQIIAARQETRDVKLAGVVDRVGNCIAVYRDPADGSPNLEPRTGGLIDQNPAHIGEPNDRSRTVCPGRHDAGIEVAGDFQNLLELNVGNVLIANDDRNSDRSRARGIVAGQERVTACRNISHFKGSVSVNAAGNTGRFDVAF